MSHSVNSDRPPLMTTNARGARIFVDPLDPRGAGLVQAGGDLNPWSLRLWQVLLGMGPWEVVLDIGVNYGEMLVGAELPAGAQVIGFEPNTDLHPYVWQTLRAAGIEVDLRDTAVAASRGTAAFAVDTTWSGTSSLAGEDQQEGSRWRHRTVETVPLDDVLGESPRSYCAKVDVEGAEAAVLDGAARSLGWSTPWAVMLEIAHMPLMYLSRLAEEQDVFVLEARSDDLIRVPGGNAELLDSILTATWTHAHDCVVLNRAAVDGWADRTKRHT